MKCVRCGKEIPEKRHMCDECKAVLKERRERDVLFSPNKVNYDRENRRRTLRPIIIISLLALLACIAMYIIAYIR